MDRAVFEAVARVERDHWFFVGRRRVIGSILRSYYEPGGRRSILDVGTGTGAMLGVLRPYGTVTAIESASDALPWCRRVSSGAVRLAQSSATKLPFVSRAFDLVTAFDVLEHIEHDGDSAEEIHRVLRVGGTFLCTVPAHPWLWSEFDDYSRHQRRYTAPALRRLLTEADLHVERMFYINAVLFAPIASARLLANALDGVRTLVGSRKARTPRGSGLRTPPPALNRALTELFAAEAIVAPRMNIPFGVTLVAIATKQ